MVLQICPHPCPVRHHPDAMLRQMCRWPHARQHQQFRRVDRRCRQHHLTPRPYHLDLAFAADLYPHRARAFKHHPPRKTPDHLHPARLLRGPQISIGRRPPPPLPDRRLERTKAFLRRPVVILRHRITRLRARLNERIKQRVAAWPPRDVQRPVGAAIAAVAFPVPMLHPLEIWQHIRIGPTLRAHRIPCIKIPRMPPHIDHAIDG